MMGQARLLSGVSPYVTACWAWTFGVLMYLSQRYAQFGWGAFVASISPGTIDEERPDLFWGRAIVELARKPPRKAGRKFEKVAENKLPDQFSASPAVADGRIYLRGFDALYAIGPASK